MPEVRPLESYFDRELANAVVGVDTLYGGNIIDPSGMVHFIADTYPRDVYEPPNVWKDGRAAHLRNVGGVRSKKDEKLVVGFINQYGLMDARGRLLSALGDSAPEHRREFVGNLGTALEAMTKEALSIATTGKHIPFEARAFAATRRAPELIDPTPYREGLAQALSEVGFEPTRSRDLKESLLAWEAHCGYMTKLPGGSLAELDEAQRGEYLAEFLRATGEMRSKLMGLFLGQLRGMDLNLAGYKPDLSDVNFDGLDLQLVHGVYFTGSMAYEGGTNPDGSPALHTLYQYNADHPTTNPAAPMFCAHELVAHHVDSVLSDLRWREGKLGLEAMISTMCTPDVALREGFAQNMLTLVCGSEEGVIDQFGADQSVQKWAEWLQDTAKNNVSILSQLQGQTPEQIQKYLKVECVLSSAFVNKMMGAWRTHPLIGPMYGPAYHLGHKVVLDAIEQYGVKNVLAACLHLNGYADIATFPKILAKAA